MIYQFCIWASSALNHKLFMEECFPIKKKLGFSGLQQTWELLIIGLSTRADYIFQLRENIYWEMTVMFLAIWKYFFPHSVCNMKLCVWPLLHDLKSFSHYRTKEQLLNIDSLTPSNSETSLCGVLSFDLKLPKLLLSFNLTKKDFLL